MKYTVGIKILAIVLAVVSLTAAIGSFFAGVYFLDSRAYATEEFSQWEAEETEHYAYTAAQILAANYAQKHLSDCPEELLLAIGLHAEDIQTYFQWSGMDENKVFYRLVNEAGQILDTNAPKNVTGTIHERDVTTHYWMYAESREKADHIFHVEDKEYYLQQVISPRLYVTMWFQEGVLTEYGGLPMETVRQLYDNRYNVLWLFGISVLVFVCAMVYLCFAAGRKISGDVPQPKGLNRIPLDLYLTAGFFACLGLTVAVLYILEAAFNTDSFSVQFRGMLIVLAVACAVTFALIVVGFLFALAAQCKGRTRMWWSNSIIGRLCKLIWQALRFSFRAVNKLFSLLPLIWQWLLILAAEGIWLVIAIAVQSVVLLFPVVLVMLATVVYIAYCCGVILAGIRQLARGDLYKKVSKRFLTGSFQQAADQLNALAEVAVTAAKKQMRSERMKTELITNVSHDIKTPLTSIINYVDLLSHTQDEQARAQYLEVLARQSQQIKRLLEDLLEMSKATTGNLTVELSNLDLAETVNQALGEYADRLEQAGLNVVFRLPEQPCHIRADGRLTWRVLSNLLSNAVKYALPGTRVYIELTRDTGYTELSVKNISREELNVPAEELMERFVRGDISRNTEGSGLGLNIAQSLMEAQGGGLSLYVDGDLFKVTLRFPNQP